MSSRTCHKTFWIKKNKLSPHPTAGDAWHWDCTSMGMAGAPLLMKTARMGHWGWCHHSHLPCLACHRERVSTCMAWGSFQMGFLGGRMGKACEGRRWGVSKASSVAAGTCFFPNRLNLPPSRCLSVVSRCLKPPASWRVWGLCPPPRPSQALPLRKALFPSSDLGTCGWGRGF